MSVRSCQGCGRRYGYPFDECTVCRSPLAETGERSGKVIAVTEVAAPSLGHEDVPYWCALVMLDDGGHAISKHDAPVAIGDKLSLGAGQTAAEYRIGIVGSGVMARGLVELFLARGLEVVWVARSLERLEIAKAKVESRLVRVMDDEQLAVALSSLALSDDLASLAECDLVIEAVVEEVEPKLAVLRSIEQAVSSECLIATNTSSLPLDVLASALEHPMRFGGMHFFNPPIRMRLVEVVRAPQTDDDTDERLFELSLALGKIPVRVANSPGFVVNRVLMPLLNEAVRALEDGVAPAEDIDEAIRLGLNHPMGPLALADLIGLDVVVNIMDDLHDRLGDTAYAPRPMLRQLVEEGKSGRKAGEGFYDYSVQ
ncbi:MAG: 3-hydroxyacyl-CoA dehydrogenase NAD-binding domain-containing protein [Actinobacteria bacterium]|nr:3-hydroxyacyl-CoA dehydrogenase NAD-binding domain-containing protein [Actinomycetota bacterium]